MDNEQFGLSFFVVLNILSNRSKSLSLPVIGGRREQIDVDGRGLIAADNVEHAVEHVR